MRPPSTPVVGAMRQQLPSMLNQLEEIGAADLVHPADFRIANRHARSARTRNAPALLRGNFSDSFVLAKYG
jgi:hypothetical protein